MSAATTPAPATGPASARTPSFPASSDPVRLARQLSDALAHTGAAVVTGVDVANDAALLALCAGVGVATTEGNGPPPGQLVRDLVWEPEDGAQELLRLHTDSCFTPSPHAVMALACASPAADGAGTSLLLTADDVVAGLDADTRDHLARQPVRFAKWRDGALQQAFTAPVLGTDPAGRPTVRYHRDHAEVETLPAPARAALARLVAVLDDATRWRRLPLGPGDVLLLDNRRALHGRTTVGGSARRLLRRVKMYEPTREP